MSKTFLVLGATSGIGRAVAHELARNAHAVVLAGRDADELEKTAADLRLRYGVAAAVRTFDAGEFDGHEAFFRDCLRAADGSLDGVVLCHGTMAEQTAAQRDFAEARSMIDVNYTSAVSILNLAADYFEQRRQGCICAVSSVAGDRGRQSNYLYGSTKAALNVYLDGLRHRLHRSGVAVVTVKPGFVDTRMTWGLPGLFLVAAPERVARDIYRAIGRGRSVVYTPWFWGFIMRLICAVPGFVFHRTRL